MSHEAVEGLPEGILAHHFASLERQNEAMRLGMWLFLATEILLFAGLFTGYSAHRFELPLPFPDANPHLHLTPCAVHATLPAPPRYTVALTIHSPRYHARRSSG